ncbi:SLAC1 anion channel family protein, partial [Campylobacter fetus]
AKCRVFIFLNFKNIILYSFKFEGIFMDKSYFSYLPVSLFGSVMGLCGLSIGWKLAAFHFGFNGFMADILALLAVLDFIILSICYAIKIIYKTQSFKDEFINPMTKSFFGTFIISILLLPIVIFEYFPKIAFILWIAGVVLMLSFAIYMVSFWLSKSQDISHVTPAWVIPVVGTLDIPFAKNLFNFNYLDDVSIAALGVGLFFAIPIFVIIKTKLLFSEPMPDKLIPTLMIILAPFSVGFSAYIEVVKNVDIFAKGLYFIGLFLFFAMLPKLRNATKCCPFRVTWWAVSFPLAALLVSTIKMAIELNELYLDILSVVFLITFTIAIFWLTYRTLKGVFSLELQNLT